jgi:hypothetical protein
VGAGAGGGAARAWRGKPSTIVRFIAALRSNSLNMTYCCHSRLKKLNKNHMFIAAAIVSWHIQDFRLEVGTEFLQLVLDGLPLDWELNNRISH